MVNASAPTLHHLFGSAAPARLPARSGNAARCLYLQLVEACGPDLAAHAHSCPTPAGIKMKASFAEEQPSSSSGGGSGGSGSSSNGSALHAEQAQQAPQQQLFGRRKWKHWFRRWQIR